MKTVLRIMMLVAVMAIAAPQVQAQSTNKELKKALKAKADKQSKKEAKAYRKQGWVVMPGTLPLEKQIQLSKYAALEKDSEGNPAYITASHKAVGGNYTAAKQIADSRLRIELASSVNTIVGQKLTESSATADFGASDYETITETISASQNTVSAQLQGVTPVLEMYRQLKDGTYEVMVTSKLDRKQAIETARMVYKRELLSKSQKLADDLDELLN